MAEENVAPQAQSPVKTVSNQNTVVESSPTDNVPNSPIEEAADYLTNSQAEDPTVALYDDSVVNSELDWSKESEPKPDITPEGVLGDAPVQHEEQLTDGMSKRITGIKRKHAEEIEGKEAEINRLQGILSQFERNMPKKPATPVRTSDDIDREIMQIKTDLQSNMETMTPADSNLKGIRVQELYRERDDAQRANQDMDTYKDEVKGIRKQNDALATKEYPWLNDTESEGYKMFQTQVYPMMERMIPNYRENPQDILLAAHLTDAQLARVDNATLRQQIGQINSGNVSNSRNIPPIASDNAPSGPPSDQSVRSRLMNGVRNGEVDGGAAALAMGLVEGYRG